MIQTVIIGMAVGLATAWIIFAALIYTAARRHHIPIGAATRVLPDTLRLLRALATDRNLPNTIRRRLTFALAYCGQPFNLIPDFIPVIGYADNIAVAAWALRSVVRLSGPDTIEDHWPGSPTGLALLYKALHLPNPRKDAPTSPKPDRAANQMPPARTQTPRRPFDQGHSEHVQ